MRRTRRLAHSARVVGYPSTFLLHPIVVGEVAPGKARAVRLLRLLAIVALVAATPHTGPGLTIAILVAIVLLLIVGAVLVGYLCANQGGQASPAEASANETASEPGGCDCGVWCGDCCDTCCEDSCDCCTGPCVTCDDCCTECEDGCCSCEACCTESSGANGTAELGVVAAAVPLVLPWARLSAVSAMRLAHHPPGPAYEQDTYNLRGLRLCIGCFTTYPLFLVASTWLILAPPEGTWSAWLAGGLALASLQVVSSLGWARRRWQKVAVKSSLGVGLAAAVHGVLASPWPAVGQQAALLGMLGLAGASAVPRALRMRRNRQNARQQGGAK